MDNLFLSASVAELLPLIKGRTVAKLSLISSNIVIDFRLPDDRDLIATLDQSFPALYLGNLEALPSEVQSSHPFLLQIRKKFTGAKLIGISKPPLDRIVKLEFEGYGTSGEKRRAYLIFSLMGRSSNAYLTDEDSIIESRLFDRGIYAPGEEFRVDEIETDFNYRELLDGLEDSLTASDLIENYFDSGALSGPLLKREFLDRCQRANPADAFRSLVEDLFEKEPQPLIYSKLPLDEFADRPANLKTDLMLSHFELVKTEGLKKFEFDSLSEAVEAYRMARERAQDFLSRLNSLRRLLATETAKLEGLLNALSRDRTRHENPDRLKRYGDLLLANIATAKVNGSKARVIDYYDESQREIEIEIGEGETLQQAATSYFSRYQKARRALAAIAERESQIQKQIEPLRSLAKEIEGEPTGDKVAEIINRLESLMGRSAAKALNRSSQKSDRTKAEKKPGRWFLSTDGYEIGVGRNDKDNDYLTFRLARSQDIWLHAGDYPGSHVVVRNPGRGDVPQQTILEAAQLAAFYSQAKNHPKAAVHYTQKKFVSKPPRAKAGLVRLSSFKTLLVEPSIKIEKLD